VGKVSEEQQQLFKVLYWQLPGGTEEDLEYARQSLGRNSYFEM
jgi:hypothetical protein